MSEKILEGKVALVTGGSRGLGAAIALRLAKDGVRVAITWSRGAEAAEAVVKRGEGQIVALQADAADLEAMTALVPTVVERMGRLDILVNNAAKVTMGPLPDVTDEDFARSFDVNVRAPFLAARAASRVMGEGGRIITIGSVNTDAVPIPGVGTYAATKAALAAFTRSWARDLFAATLIPMIALGRYGRADEVAALVAFLARPESQFITGACLNIDGGYSC